MTLTLENGAIATFLLVSDSRIYAKRQHGQHYGSQATALVRGVPFAVTLIAGGRLNHRSRSGSTPCSDSGGGPGGRHEESRYRRHGQRDGRARGRNCAGGLPLCPRRTSGPTLIEFPAVVAGRAERTALARSTRQLCIHSSQKAVDLHDKVVGRRQDLFRFVVELVVSS